jgi:hypothetical protein
MLDFNYIDFETKNTLPVWDISVEQWNVMNSDEQEAYIKDKNIEVHYTHDISDSLSRGFGKMDWNGFWEYQCKII